LQQGEKGNKVSLKERSFGVGRGISKFSVELFFQRFKKVLERNFPIFKLGGKNFFVWGPLKKPISLEYFGVNPFLGGE